MYKGRRIAVIVTAAGSGTRMGLDIPKQYVKIAGVPIVRKTVEAFAQSQWVDCIAVTAPVSHLETCKEMLTGIKKLSCIVSGGKRRQDSVANGLRELSRITDFDYVMIHDAARPYVTEEIIEDSLKTAMQYGASVTAVPVKDTIKSGSLTLERENLHIIQTPQTFEKGIIIKAHQQAASDGYLGNDDGSLVERLGLHVAISRGDYANIKITTREDLPKVQRIGKGYDVHKLTSGRDLIVGGVKIDHDQGLLGHSDADVLTHAVIDSLLGAAALGDIGKLFPDTDASYQGISSIKLLEEVRDILQKAEYAIINIDSTIIAEQPKFAPYINDMRKNIAGALHLDESCVSVKATTTEGLGFTGRMEGIAAEAVCLMIKKY